MNLMFWTQHGSAASRWGVLLGIVFGVFLFRINAGERLTHFVMDSFDCLRIWMFNGQLRARANMLRGIATLYESRFQVIRLLAQLLDFLYGILVGHENDEPNDPSSATRPAGRMDCNHDAMAGFAAAHG